MSRFEAKITDEQVVFIRTSPLPGKAVADLLGISASRVSVIRSGKERQEVAVDAAAVEAASRHWRLRGCPPERRFWQKVDRSQGVNECWLWTGAINAGGYGTFSHGSRSVLAHRFSYELSVGSIPDGFVVDHLCHNGSGCLDDKECRHRRCVNPRHLEAVTHRENVLRGYGYGSKFKQRTHCVMGHELQGANLVLLKNGVRLCRICRNAANRASYAARKGAR